MCKRLLNNKINILYIQLENSEPPSLNLELEDTFPNKWAFSAGSFNFLTEFKTKAYTEKIVVKEQQRRQKKNYFQKKLSSNTPRTRRKTRSGGFCMERLILNAFANLVLPSVSLWRDFYEQIFDRETSSRFYWIFGFMVSKEAVLWRRSQDTSLQWVERHAMSSTSSKSRRNLNGKYHSKCGY